MHATQPALGLRDRKKLQTRDTIRSEAIRLIEANGYANTTIEQIADAADISPSTFFRYFPTKEAVLMADDLERLFVTVLPALPRELSSFDAFRRALEIAATKVSENCWAFERSRQRVVFSVPELKAAQFDAYRRAIEHCVAAENSRRGRPLDDFEARVFYGSLVGALMGAIDHGSGWAVDDLFRALDFIQGGLRLGEDTDAGSESAGG